MRKTELLEDQALSTRLKVEAITLREIRMPLVHFFETSFGRTYSRRILLVTVHCDGVDGWAESVAGEDPYYSSEWTESAWPTIKQYLAPAVLGRYLNSARESVPLMAKVRGHRMAKAAVENALWDAEAKQKKQPLWKLLGGTRQEIQCGVSIGIQDSIEQLIDKVQLELAAGYRRVKLKVGRVGGFSEAKKIHDLCQANKLPVWCGGMLESGIGRAHNVALSTLENFKLPGDVSASKRYWKEDIIEPEVEVTRQGTITVSDAPGTGYRIREDLIEKLTTRKETLRATS